MSSPLLTTLVNDAIDKIKSLLSGYSTSNVHKALLYALTNMAARRKGLSLDPLKALRSRIPASLASLPYRGLDNLITRILDALDYELSRGKPIVLDLGNIGWLVDKIKATVGSVDYVLVYDCMSLLEFMVLAASLKAKGFKAIIPDYFLINPIGLTMYVTRQLAPLDYEEALRGFAKLLADKLGARDYDKKAYIDLTVHEYGLYGVEEFVDNINIETIIDEVWGKAVRGSVLVATDHGYDVIYNIKDSYIYVTHGFREPESRFQENLLPLSKFSFILKVGGRG